MGIVFGRVTEETPKFDLVAKKELYEVRRYVPYVIAAMQGIAKSQDEFGRANFRVLASYIGVFGNPQNQSQQPMAMTAPVLSSARPETIAMTATVMSSGACSDTHSMAFILPSKYTLQTAPVPSDDRIKLREVPASLVAVHTYSGNTNEMEASEKAERLMEMVQKDGYALHPDPHRLALFASKHIISHPDQGLTTVLQDLPHKQGWQLARYNPPFTLPFLKTNEIHVELAEGAPEAN